jgi:transposase
MRRRKKTEVLGVSKIKEILRLKEFGLNQSEIAKGANVARSTVQDYLRRAAAQGITAKEVESLSEEQLRELLGKRQGGSSRIIEPDYQYLRRELTKKSVTLALLWQEYIEEHPGGCSYAWFCDRYRRWKKENRLSMRQQHKAGEKLFVDYAGVTVPIYQRGTNEILYQAQIFLGVLGASNYTFAEATPSQEIKHWLGSHRRCFEFLGGVSQAVVPDNLKSGVKTALYYDPEINPAYRDFAEHYGVAILPARVKKPKDKAKVEVGVQIAERWILAALRNIRFFSLEELNQAIAQLLEKLNQRRMKSYGCNREELFECVDQPALKPLPQKPYEFFEVKLARVNIDYHVEVERHYYSVPYKLVGQEVEIRIREQTIEVLREGKRVVLHARSREKFHHTTKKEHMPPSHQAVLKWTPSRLLNWAAKIGPGTKQQVQALIDSREHPEQSYRACLGLLRLEKKVGQSRLEAACTRANQLGIVSMRRIKSILDSGMDRLPIIKCKEIPKINHRNIRGQGYYH